MPDDKRKYLIDTDVLVRIRYHPDSKAIYDGLFRIVDEGRLKTVRQVLDELKTHGAYYDFIRQRRADLVIPTSEQYCSGVQAHINTIGDAGLLWEQTGGDNPDPADPWLVGVAAHHGYYLVTNESPTSNVRIPAACNLVGIGDKCLRGPQFLIEVGLAEAKPEHIDPTAFFRGG